MSISGILFYVARAMALALPLSAAVYGLRRWRLRGKPLPRSRERLIYLFILYGAALFAITAIRGGRHLLDFWKVPHTAQSIQLIPILETWKQGRAGAWYLVYPVVGNLLWFLPMGFFLRKLRPTWRWYRIAAVSLAVSLGIEVLQWVLLSGISDIDDVIFNVLGGIIGWNLAQGC